MAASFPNAKKTFSSVVNGVNKLVAALFNAPYDEIEAEQTFIGATGGGALAYTTSVTDLLANYRQGCSCDYKSAADLYVRAGELMILDASGNKRLRRNPTDTTVTWANIDTGAEGNAVYYIYAVADASATTFTVKISTNATTPSGCTFYRLIGTFLNSTDILEVGNLSLKSFGNWVSKSDATVYQAATDGFVIGYATCDISTNGYGVEGLSDGSNPPTTIRWSHHIGTSGGVQGSIFPVFFLVKKGDYWQTRCFHYTDPETGDMTGLFWIPLNF